MFIMEISSIYQSEQEAIEMLHHLLEKRLIACGSVQELTTSYWWENEIKTQKEWLLKGKTSQEYAPFVLDDIQSHHTHEIPYISQYQTAVSGEYYEWLVEILNQSINEELAVEEHD